VELERESLSSLRRHRAIVALSMEFMDRATQAKLADYARAGGRLVLYPTLPTMDVHLAPEPLLMRALGVRRITAALAHVVKPAPALRRLGAPEEVFTEWSCSAIEAPGASVWARTPQGAACAVRRRIGRGEVALIGFGMTHRFDYQVSVAAAILQALRIHPRLEVEPWDVPVMVRAGARGQALLTICNPHEEARSVSVRVRLPDRRLRVPDAGRMMLAPRSVRMLPIGLALAKGVRVRLTTCELRLLVRAPAVSLGATLDAAGHGLLVLETRDASGVNVQGARAVCRRHGRRLRVELSGAPSAVVTLSLTSRQISFKK
jgi:beta-galactosidase